MSKYTLTGSEKLDKLIDEQLQLVTEELLTLIDKKDLVAFVLGGGYGRGEGGVLVEDGEESLYNDYDLFVITKNISHIKKKKYQDKMIKIHKKFTPMFKIDVDVGPIQTVASISSAPHWMMWYELKNGMKILWGNKNLKEYFPHYTEGEMPIMEAYRLLLNRGVGLLLCKEHFNTFEEEESREFIQRNIRKGQLAMGDAFLIKEHKFHYSYKHRSEIFEGLNDNPIVHELNLYNNYMKAYKFKISPHKAHEDKEKYLQEYKQVLKDYEQLYNYLFLDVVQDELDLDSYLKKIKRLFTGEPSFSATLKNMIKNTIDDGTKVDYLNYSLLNPRFRLFITLPYFLFDKEEVDAQKYLSQHKSTTEKEIYDRFITLWEKHN